MISKFTFLTGDTIVPFDIKDDIRLLIRSDNIHLAGPIFPRIL